MDELTGDRGLIEVESLPFWTGPIKIWPLEDGLTNRNYGVQQADGQRFAVRLGQDKPEHGVMRFNEQAAAKAAARAGISPKIFFTAPGVIVSRLLPGGSLKPGEVQHPENLLRIVALARRCHTAMASFLQGPLLAFWVFHVNRSYAAGLRKAGSRLDDDLSWLMEVNDKLEQRAAKVDITFCHNGLLAENVFDDGARLWLLGWDHAGFNAPLFDLANLSSSNGFFPNDDETLLRSYYDAAPDRAVYDAFQTFKCAALLRELLGSATMEQSLDVSLDKVGQTDDCMARLETALAALN